MGTPLFAELTCTPADDAQRNLEREFKRMLRPGGLLLISDYPLQSDQRNLDRYHHSPPNSGPTERFACRKARCCAIIGAWPRTPPAME